MYIIKTSIALWRRWKSFEEDGRSVKKTKKMKNRETLKKMLYLGDETIEDVFLEGGVVSIEDLNTKWFHGLHKLHEHTRASLAEDAEMVSLFFQSDYIHLLNEAQQTISVMIRIIQWKTELQEKKNRSAETYFQDLLRHLNNVRGIGGGGFHAAFNCSSRSSTTALVSN